MPAVTNATPLISLDAVVIDTETTSLEPRKARILEIAGIRIVSGRIEPEQTFRSLVNPRETISAFSTAIHHIDNETVADRANLSGDVARISGLCRRQCHHRPYAGLRPRGAATGMQASGFDMAHAAHTRYPASRAACRSASRP